MSWTTRQYVTLASIVLLVAAIPMVWELQDVRAAQADQSHQQDLVNNVTHKRQSQADFDGDGIPDSQDQCPTRAETQNNFQDGDGCPDVAATTGAS